jgi:6-phosphofructokinase
VCGALRGSQLRRQQGEKRCAFCSRHIQRGSGKTGVDKAQAQTLGKQASLWAVVSHDR